MWYFNVLAYLNVFLQIVQGNLCSPFSTCVSVSQAELDCLQSSSVSSWLLVSTLTWSLKYTDCVLLSDVCTSLLLLSEKLCCRSTFVCSSTHDCQLQASVNQNSPGNIILTTENLLQVHIYLTDVKSLQLYTWWWRHQVINVEIWPNNNNFWYTVLSLNLHRLTFAILQYTLKHSYSISHYFSWSTHRSQASACTVHKLKCCSHVIEVYSESGWE